MPPLDRYSRPDAYTTAELLAKYAETDDRGRIRLLHSLYRNGNRPPFELAEMVLNEGSPSVRRWLALNGRSFDYSRRIYDRADFRKAPTILNPEKDLTPRLIADPDALVRAAYHENSETLSWRHESFVLQWFMESSHFERLALVRNANIDRDFVERLFDHADTSLPITIEERSQLILAFLTNEWRVNMGSDFSWAAERRHSRNSFDIVSAYESWEAMKRHCQRLWFLASQWPTESGVPWAVFTTLGVDDETKARYYATWGDNQYLRAEVLRRNTLDTDEKVLALGIADEDEQCRRMAMSKAPHLARASRRRPSTRVWSIIGHVTYGATYAVKILLLIVLFSVAADGWQKMAFASLIVIFEAVAATERGRRWAAAQQTAVLQQETKRLRTLLHEELTEDERDRELDAAEEEEKALRKAAVRTWIASAAASVIVLFAMWQLVRIAIAA